METEMTFVGPEGVYSMTEEHKPSGHTINANVNMFPTRLSTATIRFPPTKSSQGLGSLLGVGKENKKDKQPKADTDAQSVSSSDTDNSPDPSPGPPDSLPTNVLGEPPSLFSQPPSGARKKGAARPKHNMRTTSSTFITRLHTAEGMSRALQSKTGDVTFLFYNSAKSFFWTEAGSKVKEPYTRITFTSYPTCHDVNVNTLAPDRVDVIIGFNTGDLIWFDPVAARYSRLNKGGGVSSSPCTAVRWVPSSSTLLLVAHADGTIIVYDTQREDGTFTPQDADAETRANASYSDSDSDRSATSWNPRENMFVSMPPWHPATGASAASKSDKDKDKAVKNPVSHWRISRRAITDFVFSPDVKYVAAISEDGCLRVIDALAEQLVDCYGSYFGAMTSVAWSPDGRFIITGGQDDLVTIISPWEQRVIARCQGHSSFVSALSFDELRCDGRTYRFGSVGEDNKLILWDFSSGALHRPKHAHHQSGNMRMSMGSTLSLARRGAASSLALGMMPGAGDSRFHPAPGQNDVAIVQPVLIKSMEADILSSLAFLPRGLLTSTKTGHIKLWIRPLSVPSRKSTNGRSRGMSGSAYD